ncbi:MULTISPECIES: hypothetical protein [Pseudomonas]|uniref:hypothetical protein n=1 Tax=Pseudomonas TaxID=286 RepID=UPI001179CFCD|nr:MULTISPECIES: hypothetical protein [Pseudomonas]
MSLFCFAVFFVWGMLLTHSGKNSGSITPIQLLELGVVSVGVVIFVVASWYLLREIWLEHGDDISRSLGERVARFFK